MKLLFITGTPETTGICGATLELPLTVDSLHEVVGLTESIFNVAGEPT
jgi:hypothetical protein